jgi:hypothetical protein
MLIQVPPLQLPLSPPPQLFSQLLILVFALLLRFNPNRQIKCSIYNLLLRTGCCPAGITAPLPFLGLIFYISKIGNVNYSSICKAKRGDKVHLKRAQID